MRPKSPLFSTEIAILAVALMCFPSCEPSGPESLCQLTNPATISFTSVPPLGSVQSVVGSVGFANAPCFPDQFRVALYIHVPSFSPDFICKPADTNPLTSIGFEGDWDALYATGGMDTSATQLIAFLVTSSFAGPCFTDQLPSVAEDPNVLASITAER